MKLANRFSLPFFVLALAAAEDRQTLTPADRDFLTSHLETSRQELLKSIAGLTKEQWNHQPAGGGWSIAQCAEHLAATEDGLFGMVTGRLLKLPVAADRTRFGRAEDEKLIARIVDRSEKAKAPETLQPSGKFPTPESFVAEFHSRRQRSIEWVKSTQDDLRGRVSGSMDAYQYLVLMSAHTLRHTAQLNEVKQDAKYPR
ncbi:MAG: DinB family protein [Bryobacteraceae bacterium]|nr:DinB family protein [Bryobacteraceae bacterium]